MYSGDMEWLLKKKNLKLMLTLLVILGYFVSQKMTESGLLSSTILASPSPVTLITKPSAILSANREAAKVTRIIDGDTIELEDGRKVRYIGIDTPETKDPRRDVECFGAEAAAFNSELVLNQMVQLERDVSETDRYGRLLRYVYLDQQLVNETLVLEGYAKASTFPPDIAFSDRFSTAEKTAKDQQKGLWGTSCVPD